MSLIHLVFQPGIVKTLFQNPELMRPGCSMRLAQMPARGQFVEGLEVFPEPLIAQLPPAEVAPPTERPPRRSGSRPARCHATWHLAVRRQPGADPPRHHRGDDRLDPVRPVALERLRSAPRPASSAAAGRDGVEHLQRQRPHPVGWPGRCGPPAGGRPRRSRRGACSPSCPRSVGFGPGVHLPSSARIEALSITAPPVLRLLDWERLVIGPEGRIDRRLYTFCAGTAPGRTPTTRPVRAHQPAAGVIPTPCSCKGRPGRRCGSGVCRTLGRSPGADEELESLGQAARRSLPADPPATFRPIPP